MLAPTRIASAIEINRPGQPAQGPAGLDRCGGVVREVSDQEILDAKAKVGAGGLGCEPASAASVAGAKEAAHAKASSPRASASSASSPAISSRTRPRRSRITAPTRRRSTKSSAIAAFAGRTFANRAVQVPNDLDEIIKAIEVYT